jgi:hypothetical protein
VGSRDRARAPRAPAGYNPGVPVDGWTLISVLLSTIPLEASLAATLHQAALELYRNGRGVQRVAGDVVSGRVVNLRKTLALGAISGPAFEAKLETARGSGIVRYLLTTEALAGEEPAASRPARRLLN